jgi:hypothetical protein
MKLVLDETQLSRRPTSRATYVAIALWIAVAVAGYFAVVRYEFTTADIGASRFADRWPTDSGLPRQAGHSTLIMFLHPKCPCSKASLNELDRLFVSNVRATDDKLDFIVDATVPASPTADWLQTDVLELAARIKNSRIVFDRGGGEASRFGATTSGCVMLFDQTGQRQYAGGVTASRGHEGDNVGCQELAEILNHQINHAESMPTFGCRLCLPDENSPQQGSTTATM